MPIRFETFIALQPIAASPRARARQAVATHERLAEAGDLARIRADAIGAFYSAALDDPPNEVRRLRLLYKDVYTRDELEAFVRATLAELGFDD